MQVTNWNDLRYVLAIARTKRIPLAASLLRVDDTTVTRRLNALQTALGKRLYHRLADGTLELTQEGVAAAGLAERIEQDMRQVMGDKTGPGQLSGSVRLTAVPFMVNRILIPAAGDLLTPHPELVLELISDRQNLSLARREADMALRLGRPKTGGMRVTARRLGLLDYAPYRSNLPTPTTRKPPGWITYEDGTAHYVQSQWIDKIAQNRDESISGLKINDIEAAIEAVANNIGRSVLPCKVADPDKRLQRLDKKAESTPMQREVWLLFHSELKNSPRIAAVIRWLDHCFADKSRLSGTAHTL
ncbi:MAG: LysR family transcriptional regulator [Sneathiella sp.]|nr:LysR family transcriptional regulator [Sneathiella sp.]